jgi:hypothetical protein
MLLVSYFLKLITRLHHEADEQIQTAKLTLFCPAKPSMETWDLIARQQSTLCGRVTDVHLLVVISPAVHRILPFPITQNP